MYCGASTWRVHGCRNGRDGGIVADTGLAVVPPPGSVPAGRYQSSSGQVAAEEVSARWRRRASVFAVFLVATLVMVHGTPGRLTSRLPGDHGDAVEVLWILRWGGHAFIHQPLHLFDANIFWPLKDTLAFAEPLLSIAPFYALFFGITGNWVLSWNLLWIGLILLNQCATYSLTRWLTGRTDAAIFSGLAVGFSAFVLGQSGHPQLQVIGFVPLGLLLLFKLMEEPRLLTAAALGLTTLAILLGSLYIAAAYAMAVFIILAGQFVLERGRIGWAMLRGLVLAGIISLLAWPEVVAFHEVSQQIGKRPLVPEWGLRPRDLVRAAPGSYLYKGLARNTDPGAYERHMFPGFVTVALAVVGVLVLLFEWRRTRGRTRTTKPTIVPQRLRFVVLLITAGVVIGVLAVGALARGPWTPWRGVYRYVGPLSGIRVPARLAYVSILAGAVLAGVGLAGILRRLAKPALATVLTAIVSLAVMAELAAPIQTTSVPHDPAILAVYQALSHDPAGVVVELPVYLPEPYTWAYGEAPRMLWSTIDFHPRVNGYGGYVPDKWYQSLVALQTIPAPGGIAQLRDLKVRYIILHLGLQAGLQMYTDAQAAAIIAGLPANSDAKRLGSNYLVDLAPAGPLSAG